MQSYTIHAIIGLIAILSLFGCNGGKTGSEQEGQNSRAITNPDANKVIIHELADPDKLNPATSSSANSTYIEYNLFTYLLDVDKETLEIIPSLAKERPEIRTIEEGPYAGGISLVYEIRPEARWDNGTPVLASDVEFTYKAIKNPLVDSDNLRPYLDFIDDFEIDPENPRRFTIYSKNTYFMAEFASGNVFILPEYIYDPEGIMRKFTIRELNNPETLEKLRSDPDIIRFANAFNSEKHQREAGFVVGSGPYRLKEWVTGQRVVLERKENWWGDQLAGKVFGFEAYPEILIYEIINDWTTAITACKDGTIDVARGVRPKDFVDLQEDKAFNAKYHLFTPLELSYVYIGINMKDPRLSDKRVRKALAHLVDVQQIIDVLMYGMAEPINGPVHPTKKYYNSNLKPYEFDISKAKALLAEAGWRDNDGDGILDKTIDGKKYVMRLRYKYNSGNDTREKIGLMLKENARKAGIDIEIIAREWTVYLDELRKNHDFDLFCLGWIQDPIIDDMKQIWHTEYYNNGSNYVGFGNEKTDALIESIRHEMDVEKRNAMYKELQAIIHDEVPYIFLYTPKNRLLMNKRFENARAYIARPGYQERALKVRAL